ncbi:MAG: hypothetical protein HWD86_10290 [Kangiellaceae bacterium]|nr:hypothetical protein [Kangiellaceae bacterium]
MKKLLPLITLLSLGIPTLSNAASSPYDCGAISDNEKRLVCYDGFFKNKSYTPSTIIAPQKSEVINKNEDSFGQEQLDKSQSNIPEQLNSRAVGIFKTWSKNLEINLENGQIWKVVSDRDVYFKTKNPKVSIEQGFLSVYYMRIEGLSSKLKVKRIK